MPVIFLECRCGGKRLSTHAVCYDCHLEGLLPKRYSRREMYSPNSDHVMAATRKPKTGRAILDTPGPTRVCDLPRIVADEIIAKEAKELAAVMGELA